MALKSKAELKSFKGAKYGRLKILKVFRKNSILWAKCICSCKDKTICKKLLKHILSGHTQSCGCILKEIIGKIGKLNIKYKSEDDVIIHTTLKSMLDRCYNKNTVYYKYYGGRGITVYKPWRSKTKGFKRFKKWLLSDEGIGLRSSNKHSIDRYPDNNGNYEPGNLRWANIKQQNNNKRQANQYTDKKYLNA